MWNGLRVFAFLGMVAVLLVGCPPPGGWPAAPFDATGTYVGTWQGRTNEPEVEKQQEILACPLTVTLTQDMTATYPKDHAVQGTVEIDYSCLEEQLPAWVEEIPPNIIQVSGIVADDGKMALFSGGCGTGMCVVLSLGGEGTDIDADVAMDTYSGSWSFVILLAGVPPFGVSGTFEVNAVD